VKSMSMSKAEAHGAPLAEALYFWSRTVATVDLDDDVDVDGNWG